MKLHLTFILGCLCGGVIACQVVDVLNAYAKPNPHPHPVYITKWEEPPEVINLRNIMASMPLGILKPPVSSEEQDDVAELINSLNNLEK